MQHLARGRTNGGRAGPQSRCAKQGFPCGEARRGPLGRAVRAPFDRQGSIHQGNSELESRAAHACRSWRQGCSTDGSEGGLVEARPTAGSGNPGRNHPPVALHGKGYDDRAALAARHSFVGIAQPNLQTLTYNPVPIGERLTSAWGLDTPRREARRCEGRRSRRAEELALRIARRLGCD
jgi:hypothetical protein